MYSQVSCKQISGSGTVDFGLPKGSLSNTLSYSKSYDTIVYFIQAISRYYSQTF